MGISVKGLTLKGISFKGQEWLLPTDIATCLNWYKWKEGITVDGSGNVSQWDDSGGSDNIPLVQGTSTRRPAYDSATGKITFDGVNDYLNTGTLPVLNLPGGATVTVVFEVPSGSVQIWNRVRSTAADTDAIRGSCNGTLGILSKSVAVGTGQVITSNPGMTPASGKVVVTWDLSRGIYVNGVEVSYAARVIVNSYSDTASPRLTFGAAATNTGGLPATPTTFYNVSHYEFCMHNKRLTSLERTKLVNYFKVKHGIL